MESRDVGLYIPNTNPYECFASYACQKLESFVWMHTQIKVEIESTFPPEAVTWPPVWADLPMAENHFKKILLSGRSQDAFADILGYYIFPKKKEKPLVGKALDLGIQTEKRHKGFYGRESFWFRVISINPDFKNPNWGFIEPAIDSRREKTKKEKAPTFKEAVDKFLFFKRVWSLACSLLPFWHKRNYITK